MTELVPVRATEAVREIQPDGSVVERVRVTTVVVPVGSAAPVVVVPELPPRPALISNTATVTAARNATGAP